MPDVDVPITAGTGTQIRCFQKASTDYDQYTREARATSSTLNTWNATTTGTSAQIASDVTRVAMIMVSAATGQVYIRFDSTIPNPATPAYDWYLQPGDRWEVPKELCQLAVSFAAAVNGGQILTRLATCA